jgi:hypothetical protein
MVFDCFPLKRLAAPSKRIFFLTFNAKNLIYESHCDLLIANFTFRENQSMKYANNPSTKGAKKTTSSASSTATKKKKKAPKKK